MLYVKKAPHFLKASGLFFFFIAVFFYNPAKAQSMQEYDEVSIFLSVQRIGGAEIPALIKDEAAYLPISDIFNFLHIKNLVSAKIDSVTGFFIDPKLNFIIDKRQNHIVYGDKIYELQPGDLIGTSINLYLRSDYFGKIFGLNCTFSFRNLSVVLSTDLELPVIRELRQEQMRGNVDRLKGELNVDTTIGRTYPLFHFGTANYSVLTSTDNQSKPTDVRLNLGLGGIIAGGETNIAINYYNNSRFSWRDQYYLWRLVDNNHRFAKQISAGKIQGQSIASVYAPIIGVQITNAPTTYRRSFGTYTLSNNTEPNWIVELYVNGVLTSYVKADAAGFYTFNVHLVYGNSMIKLRFYGPYGEERTSEQNISIPFNFLPENEFEYTASAGIVEDSTQSRFTRFSSNYGLSKSITIGGGAEYLSSVRSGTTIPFLNASVRLLKNLLFSVEYDYNVRSKALLSYSLPSGLHVELNNAWYKRGQTSINNTYLEDRKIILSFPLRGRLFSAYSRVTMEQIILPNTKYTTAEWLVSTSFGNYSASVNNYALFIDKTDPYVFSLFSVAIRANKNLLITQQIQYEYAEQRVVAIKTELEKRVFRNGFVNVSYEKNFVSNINNTEIGLRYDFSFAQTRVNVRKSDQVITYLQSASGSFIYDGKSKYTSFNNHTSVGKGAVILIPYLDMNGSGQRDADEPKVPGLKIRINGGRIEQGIKDSTIRITDLEAYANYRIELDSASFENVAWRLHKKIYSVAIDPNIVKRVEVPILVLGQVSGRIILTNNNEEKGMGRILIDFYNNKSVRIASTVSEIDGYFTCLGLLPGKYSARLDSAQLTKLHLVSSPPALFFTIIRNVEGSVVDDLTFVINSTESNHIPKDSLIKSTPVIIPRTNDQGITIQTAFFKRHNALSVQAFLTKHNYKVVIVPAKKSYFNVRIKDVGSINEAKRIIKKLKQLGFPDAYILKNHKQ